MEISIKLSYFALNIYVKCFLFVGNTEKIKKYEWLRDVIYIKIIPQKMDEVRMKK